MRTVSTTRVVASPKVAAYVREHGGSVWVWLDPHRCLVGSYIQLEAHTEPPGTSRRTRLTRSSRRLSGHRFHATGEGIPGVGNGCVFAGDDVTAPNASG